MVTVNSNDELLKKCSYVAISSYRRKVLETLKNDVKIPTKISEESGVGIKHVSNVLTDLKEQEDKEWNRCCMLMFVVFLILCILGKAMQ